MIIFIGIHLMMLNKQCFNNIIIVIIIIIIIIIIQFYYINFYIIY